MKKLLLIGLTLAVVGCANQRFDLKPTDASASYDDSQTFWIAGIGQSESIDGAKICGSAAKVAKVETQLTAGNIGLTIITLGIYSPRQVRVTCTK